MSIEARYAHSDSPIRHTLTWQAAGQTTNFWTPAVTAQPLNWTQGTVTGNAPHTVAADGLSINEPGVWMLSYFIQFQRQNTADSRIVLSVDAKKEIAGAITGWNGVVTPAHFAPYLWNNQNNGLAGHGVWAPIEIAEPFKLIFEITTVERISTFTNIDMRIGSESHIDLVQFSLH